MLALIIDFETSGLDFKKDRIIEIGAQVVNEKWDVLASTSSLINEPDITLSHEIQDLTGITQKMLAVEGIPRQAAFSQLSSLMIEDIKYAIAYNSEFDYTMFHEELVRTGASMDGGLNYLWQLPWLCGMVDVERNYKFKCWKLAHLALDHGLTVSAKDLHRAINDVDITRRMLKHIGETPDNMFKFKQEPWATLQALVPPPWEDNSAGINQAKKCGFNYETAKGDNVKHDKKWVKRVKERFVDVEIVKAPFSIKRLSTVSE